MRSRSRSIRSKLVLLLLVPLLSLTALWGFGAAITVGPGLSLLHVDTLVDLAKSGDALSGALQAERRAAAVESAKPGPAALRAFTAARHASDRAAAAYFRKADGDDVRSALGRQALNDIGNVHDAVGRLDTTRAGVAAGQGSAGGVLDAYTAAITSTYTVTDATIVTFADARLVKRSRDVLGLERVRETLSQEDAVMAAVLADGGPMSTAEHARFASAMGVQRYEYAQVVPEQSEMVRSRYAAITDSAAYMRLRGMENRVFQAAPGTRPGITAGEWQAATGTVLKQQQAALVAGADELTAQGKPIATRVFGQLLVTGLFGLIAVAASLIISVRVSRNLIRELRLLRHRAREIAEERLPDVVRRMRAGEQIDVDAEITPGSYGTTEFGQVDAAIGSVQRTAMEEAVGETRLRSGIRGVFVNLARRSQALLHRQLQLLDGMERSAEDPDELDRLFQLDHLATRMRRHAEGLIILSGNTPGRNWRRPVPMVDVIRAAVAEVEDYQRVTVQPMPDAALSGPAVADVVHLVAELVENATLYSPPHTEVTISAELVGGGYVVEIDDRGLSMSPEDLAEANQKLSAPPEFDLSESARLGLFVVARLARRHGIRVSLRVSPYGGTTAIMLLPGDLVLTDDTAVVDTGPFGERVRPAGVGEGAAQEEGLGRTGRLRAAPEIPDGGEEPGRVPHVAPVPDPGADAPARNGGPAGVPAHPLRAWADAAQEPDGSEGRWRSWAEIEAEWADAEAAPEPDGSADPDAARGGPAPYPAGSAEELPRTQGGLPRRVRTEVRDAVNGEAARPNTPAGAVPFAAPGESERSGEAERDLFAPRTDPEVIPYKSSADEAPGPVQSDRSLPPLPRRVRQASIAPQLRTDTRADDLELDLGLKDAEPAGGRTPEQARSMMASIQQGWLRGRADDPGPAPHSGRTQSGPAHAGDPAKEEHS